MSAHDLDEFFVHSVRVEKYLGEGSNGSVYAPAVLLSPTNTPPNGVFADDARKLVRNGKGDQVVSETTLYTSIDNAALFVEKSRVTVVNDADEDDITPSRAALVIKVNANDSGDLDLPDHVAVSLT
ncbi:hypothetical protein [Leifsonia sp. TF02-11]|uniref:hypothetical protein n=1 Tax=Leifsonia sp. TF02-11 TaxID=2815212 RepID=UPI001AA149D5|nr:hypothetical protein [Leifsonia sp. TF02-11]MBO1739669.1 hypothetical protein [Leifsonia sp. TF02-11]